MEQACIRVRGMVCRQCEDTLALGLARLRGVASVDASYDTASVTVGFDPNRLSRAAIEDKLAELGYPAGEGITGAALDVLSVVLAVALFALLRAFPLPMAPHGEAGQSLTQLFLIGMLTSVHCLAMCGGIMLANTAAPKTAETRKRGCTCGDARGLNGAGVRAALAYNGGRVVSYALVGALFGALGSVIAYAAGFKAALFSLAGVLVVAMGLRMMGFAVPMPKLPVPRNLGRSIRAKAPRQIKPLVIGLLTGIMPCGALASMWMVAAGAGTALAGGAAMLAFALGTVPLMLAFSAAGHLMPASWSKYLLRVSSILVVALGLSLAAKGIALIPVLFA